MLNMELIRCETDIGIMNLKDFYECDKEIIYFYLSEKYELRNIYYKNYGFHDSIKDIYIRLTKITGLPRLPKSLEILTCHNNYLNFLPELKNLKKLKVINCDLNNLTILPELNDNLESLSCEDNKLIKLPKLSKNLKILYCDNNKLKNLPTLPDNLEIITCCENDLVELPRLPKNLEILHCTNNKLKKLPDNLIELRNLQQIHFLGNEIELSIQQINFINRINNKVSIGIYSNSQNVHDSHIQKCLYDNIKKLMKI